ncbi:hypothetical protein [Sphingomonas sp.]|uniref:hypothetical protein n=1 Tax=Sphingomonas sp. TaxID=28214 RepID=UPI001B25E1F9|nr:hypothetical protein [Sphingomonas sp.]MBO9713556.1 hypothetical protein [Sphingomonas sp.]
MAGAAALAVLATPAAAQERSRGHITPYIEAGQVVTADLGDGGDVLTYSTLALGVDASIHTRRVEVQLDYRYERRFDYQNHVDDGDIHAGLATVRARVTPGLTMEAGGIATRVRSDIRGAAGTGAGNVRNMSQVYSGYVGPNLSEHVGPIAVNAAYRFGYTRAENATGGTGLPAGTQPLNSYDDSKVHVATASIGTKSGTLLPVGVTVSGSYTREDAGQLDQRFEGKYGRGDLVLPIARGVAIEGGAGYESIRISARDPLLDGTGKPVVDSAGRQQVDPNSGRRLAYDFDGLFWDAGVVWRPSPRTFLEARVGKRYGSMSYTGSFSYKMGPESGIQIGVYDSVDSFGRQLGGTLASLPGGFVTGSGYDPFGSSYSGCVFGTSGGSAGTCMNNALASLTTDNYRARGVTAVLVMSRGPNHIGFGAGYARRNYLAPDVPGNTGLQLNGSSDELFYGQFFASHDFDRNASIGFDAYASYSKTTLAGTDPVFAWGGNSIFTRRFGHLSASAAVGIYGYNGQGDNSDTVAQGQVSLRYGF